MSETAPPFRAEHIGSLLRPASLLALRAKPGTSVEQLAKEEDAAIASAIALKERVGLRLATDGEFRRRSYHSYFFSRLGEIVPDRVDDSGGVTGRGAQPRAVIDSRLRDRKSTRLNSSHT